MVKLGTLCFSSQGSGLHHSLVAMLWWQPTYKIEEDWQKMLAQGKSSSGKKKKSSETRAEISPNGMEVSDENRLQNHMRANQGTLSMLIIL